MKIEEFIKCLEKGDIPKYHPTLKSTYPKNFDIETTLKEYRARNTCIEYGMWAIVDKCWTKQLADWIGKRSCLEIMSGAGWLAKALSEHNINIIATDNFSWEIETQVFEILNYEAIDAVKKFNDKEILICSWPPYKDNTLIKVCNIWGGNKPIIYIGEGCNGCNTIKKFFDNFREIENAPTIYLPSWYGIRDEIYIGTWKK